MFILSTMNVQLIDTDTNTEIGGIFKEYAGFVNQALTGAEKYTITCNLKIYFL